MKRRCAIYTRKSTEEGLEQAFNSLDAQREACAAYILSQTHEGWELINEQYDDGGWSGGNMARPGLQQLLVDVAAGKVDVIIVYKVDRLTRSLADFARIVDTLDGAGASFVSVTQAFNTTSSMGRLTLNVLLSFAQFEREVTSERIRDKVSASKRKDMWMGGPVPIGYRLADRKLVIADEEAEVVRSIFERYVVHRSICLLADELAAGGVRTKERAYANGRRVGGIPFTTGPLAALLKNPVYLGKVAHAGSLYDGEHEPIISQQLWDEVQQTLATNRRERREGRNARYPSLLTGMITDPEGRTMSPTFSTRGGQRHHYYVTRLQPGEDRKSGWRLPARDIDRAVIASFATWLVGLDQEMDHEARDDTRASIPLMSVPEQRTLLLKHEAKLSIRRDHLIMTFTANGAATEIRMAATIARKGAELKLVVGQSPDDTRREPDPVLLKLITLAHVARRAKLAGSEDALVSRYSKAHLQQLLRISWLAPDIIAAIADGRQPPTLTGRRLLRATNIPLSWAAQRKLFGSA
jgi:DNA invertase Pin-like site-specific DNA recombinase